MKPYTYLIELKHTGQKYYGVKFALDADPDTFWIEYFTSSKIIHDLIDKHGTDAFVISIDKVFDTPAEAVAYEAEYLKSVQNKHEFLNQHFGSGFNRAALYKTELHKKNISEANRKPKTGKALEAVLNNQKKAVLTNTGNKQSAETQNKKRKSYKEYWNNLEDKSRPYLYKPVVVDGYVFESVKAVMERYNISRPTVINRINSNKWNWYYATIG